MISEKTIKLVRTLKGFSQAGVAHEMGISQSTFSNMENRKTPLKKGTSKNWPKP